MSQKDYVIEPRWYVVHTYSGYENKVIWPTPKQLVNNTIAVVTIVLITGVIVFALDVVFDLGNKYGITQLQNIVDEQFNKEEKTENADDAEKDTSTTEDSAES